MQQNRPKYRVVRDLIRTRIDDGTLIEGEKLPSEPDMARDFGVAYMTLRRAINALVEEGLLQRIHGKGTYVLRKAELPTPRTLALVVPSLPHLWNVSGLYYFPAIVQGFCAEATRLGFEPTIIGRDKGAFNAVADVNALAGVACLLTEPEDIESIEWMRNLGVPLCGINAYKGRRAISYVAADQGQGAADAVRMLVDQGHQHIAFFAGPEGNLGAREREQGFRRGMAECGLKPMPVPADPSDYSDGSGYARARELFAPRNRTGSSQSKTGDAPYGTLKHELLDGRELPTAIVTAGDAIAAGVMQALVELGLSVPHDVSVVGYGNFHIAHLLHPGLTTVRLPLAELGAAAAVTLEQQCRGARTRQVTILETELIERHSVAPPRSNLAKMTQG
jgi:LacI family transcriptional regulator